MLLVDQGHTVSSHLLDELPRIIAHHQSSFWPSSDFAKGTLGARLFRPGSQAKSIGWVVRAGSDFPDHVRRKLESWKCSFVLRQESCNRSTRGRLSYKDELGSNAMLIPLVPKC
jgi:hypothetical protein